MSGKNINISAKKHILFVLVAIASLLYLVEGLIPRPLPWLKLGFANIITVVVIYYFNFGFLIKFILFRIVAGALITASFFTPSFFLSLTGGLLSGIAMYILKRSFKENISPVGLSVAGAAVHLMSQTVVVYMFIINDKTVFFALPYILITSLFTGTVTGYITCNVIENLERSKFKKFLK